MRFFYSGWQSPYEAKARPNPASDPQSSDEFLQESAELSSAGAAGVRVLCECRIRLAPAGEQVCPRSAAGSTVQNPPELRSQNGVLEVSFHFKYQATTVGQGPPRYCYITDTGMESPTLRVHPGDQLIIHFHNDLPPAQMQPMKSPMTNPPAASAQSSEQTDCEAVRWSAAMTNLHFHGLSVPPTCHQDDVIGRLRYAGRRLRLSGARIPQDEPPGLYWYHPHPHGFSERQVQGGASGALIVEGLENVNPSLAGLRSG